MSLLIVAFDGLDYQLIKKYNCENLMQSGFGKIKLKGFSEITTPEIFSAFLTGKDWRENGIKGYYDIKLPFIRGIRNFFIKHFKTPLISKFSDFFLDHLEVFYKSYEKSDLKSKTFLDEFEKTKALGVPLVSDTKPPEIEINGVMGIIKKADKVDSMTEKELFKEIKDNYQILMAYFVSADWYQHIYLFKEENKNYKEIREVYDKIDELAKKIKEEAKKEGYETVMFFSDHGIPTEYSHRKRAFYSFNKTMNLEEAEMKDFYSLIKKIAEK